MVKSNLDDWVTQRFDLDLAEVTQNSGTMTSFLFFGTPAKGLVSKKEPAHSRKSSSLKRRPAKAERKPTQVEKKPI